MPRAEVGSTKHLNNKLKSKGLQRLRWYCQVCERQMRDENGFKCHTQSESHVRQMLLIGEDPNKHIQSYSNDFLRDFLQLLKTSHGEKGVHVNHFYQEYIANKEHIHMNATKWPSLSEFAKFLGREGHCRVEETEKGLHIAWIDNSPEALRRQDAIRKKERQDKGDEEREQKLIQEQVERAKADAEAKRPDQATNDQPKALQREEGAKIKLNFSKPLSTSKSPSEENTEVELREPATTMQDRNADNSIGNSPVTSAAASPAPEKVSLKFGSNKPKNVFALASKQNALSSKAVRNKEAPKKPISQAERIMKEELERKRHREINGSAGVKKQRIA
ncbi:zinc finger protein RTS2 [Xylona heveae TC161]|uniref:Zinc finger protein RTS2 n=1 Tax=Xylona heveae (strain CBS 132557 / TC161) TaxID=1328760 RepID=A0A165GW42_XYLHT|nr:zinc finger protein RTS2 [Xylona heveae TC161]KZF22672.1 zinc finger protein RTS2 [Xylona heveae TC161]